MQRKSQRVVRSPLTLALFLTGLIVGTLGGLERTAQADVANVYAKAQGGTLSNDAVDPSAALGWQLGGQLFFLEAYANQTYLDSDVWARRLVIGPVIDFDIGTKWELTLRAGIGLLQERGGALTGNVAATDTRNGVVARIGGSLERSLSRLVSAGVAVDAERFAVDDTGLFESDSGEAFFLSGFLKFELGL